MLTLIPCHKRWRETGRELTEERKLWEKRDKEKRQTKGRAKKEADGWRVEMGEGAAQEINMAGSHRYWVRLAVVSRRGVS